MFANSEDEDSFFEGGAQGGIFSLAQLEKQAAKDTGNMLAELEHRLYDAPIILTPPPQELSMSIGHNADNSEMRVDQGIWPTHEFRRFADNEYNAHTDTMENHELQQWQQTFPYLRVVGQGLKGLDAGSLHNEAQTEITIKPLLLDNNNKSDIPSTEDGICVGFQIEPKSPTTSPTPSSQVSTLHTSFEVTFLRYIQEEYLLTSLAMQFINVYKIFVKCTHKLTESSHYPISASNLYSPRLLFIDLAKSTSLFCRCGFQNTL